MHAQHYPQSVKTAFERLHLAGGSGFITTNIHLVEDDDRRKVYRAYTKNKCCYELVSANVDGKQLYYMDDVTDPVKRTRIHPNAEHYILISILDYNESLLKGG